mmetsp:Transcript_31913/g.52654  ORF Transcript_31913/g.52654 Transcript_31913/m.52654 type:complete len:288 (+) Transcript_31913:102-965(+)
MQSEEAKKKHSIERSSSFARSFYRRPENPGEGAAEGAAQPNNNFPVPKARPMGRRQSSRRSGDGPPLSSSMQAAAALVPENEPLDDGFIQPPDGGRANSWYMEALQQGNSPADLDNILGTASAEESNESGFGGFDDEEVLEQYRIMAHHEANLRVKENTGFDIAEYEKRRKLQGGEPTDKRGLYGGGKKPKIRLPDPKKFLSSSSTPKPEEPPLPTPKLNKKFLKQEQPFIPELCPGVTVRGGATVPNNEHIVRCLGCRGQLRVKILATLVSCPDCNTVSPASSTRR